MTLAGWLAAMAVGVLAGGISALTGIGGGAIMVPFLYFFLAQPELAGAQRPETAVVAHATSLLVMVPISARGAWIYHRAGLVDWKSASRVGGASVIAAVLGARAAIALPNDVLKVAFGVFLLVAGGRLLMPVAKDGRGSSERPAGYTVRALAGGALVGFIAALLGVGGGLVAIPLLIYGLRVPIERVPATSLVIVFLTALVGVLAYTASGWSSHSDASAAFTYVDPWAGTALAAGALLAVPLGTRLQRKLPAHVLHWLFAGLFVGLGARIIFVNLN